MEKRIEVVSQYLVLGNMKMVAAITGVRYDLIRTWKGQPWWKELEAEIRSTQNIEMDTKLTKIVDKSLDAVLDRVENGDYIYDQKSGEIRRKPAALRDVHRVSVDMLSKRELIRGGADARKETTQISVQEQLKMLAQEFAKWVDKDKRPVIDLNPEDVTDIEARYESQGNEESQMDSTEFDSDEIYAGDEQDGLGTPDEGEQDNGPALAVRPEYPGGV